MRLSWRVPNGCPEAAWVLARVARHLDRSIATDRDAPLAADVAIEATRDGAFAARLALASSDGRRERSLIDRDCVLVADAIAFIIAVAIDPSVQASDAPLTAEERARATPTPGDTTGSDSAPDSEPRGDAVSGSDFESESESESGSESESESASRPAGRALRVAWAVGAQASLAWQPLPGLAPGVLVHGAARFGRFVRAELTLGYSPAQRHPLPSDRTVEVRFDHALAALAGCALAPAAGSELGACLRVLAGAVRGHGGELSDGRDRALPHVALALGPLLMLPLGDAAVLRFELAATVAVARPSFVLDTGEQVYDAEIVGFVAAIGGELRFD